MAPQSLDDLNQALGRAVISGACDRIAGLLAEGADPSSGPFGMDLHTLPTMACYASQPAALKLLIEAGASPNEPNGRGLTPAMMAAIRSHPDCLRVLLDAGCSVDLMSRGSSALHAAAANPNAACLAMLVAAGARLDAPSGEYDYGTTRFTGARTPAMLCAHHGHKESLALLIAAGADLLLLDSHGKDARQIALDSGHVACAGMILAEIQRRELDACSEGGSMGSGSALRI